MMVITYSAPEKLYYPPNNLFSLIAVLSMKNPGLLVKSAPGVLRPECIGWTVIGAVRILLLPLLRFHCAIDAPI